MLRAYLYLIWAGLAFGLACDGGTGGQGWEDVSPPIEEADVPSGDIGPGDDTEGGEAGAACVKLPGDPAFDDATFVEPPAERCLLEWMGATPEVGAAIKFVVTAFAPGGPHEARLLFYEPAFYRYHDELAYFRWLNGHAFSPLPQVSPVRGLRFSHVADIYGYLSQQESLPLQLQRLQDGRIYSPLFYQAAALSGRLGARQIGIGSLIYYPPHAERPYAEALWAFELEFMDRPDREVLARYWEVFEAALPAQVLKKLRWVTRSPEQGWLLEQLQAEGDPMGALGISADALVVAGEVEVYNPGISAGFIRILEPDEPVDSVREDEIVILSRVPDEIPANRALISAVPQTPLAHVALLAKSRGTPNAYVGGIDGWWQLKSWAWARTPVLVEVSEGAVRWKALRTSEYAAFLERRVVSPRAIPQVPEVGALDWVLDLGAYAPEERASLVPVVGGKAAGFLSFSEVEGMLTPERPVGITIRAFAEHQESLVPLFRAAMADPYFEDPRMRYLALEGEAAYRRVYGGDAAALALAQQVRGLPEGHPFAGVVRQGGFKHMLREKLIAYEAIAAIYAALKAHYAALSPLQGLRFRSSSTAEDIEGFNGAGLYESFRGYLYPSAQSSGSEREKTVAWAIAQTWASYWNFRAFEERRLAGIDHFEGNMAIAVHPRFDNGLEEANAVATMSIFGYGPSRLRRFEVNVQAGSRSVTNPDGSGALPEISEVLVEEGEAPVLRRVAHSSLLADGEWILSEEEVWALFEQADAHATRWLQTTEAGRPEPEQAQTIVLDYELKKMAPGWPLLREEAGGAGSGGMIWRQARVLDRAPAFERGLADPWLGEIEGVGRGLPEDILGATRAVVVEQCVGAFGELRIYEALTEPSEGWRYPFTTQGFVYKAWLHFDPPAGTWPAGWEVGARPWLLNWRHWTMPEHGDGLRLDFHPGLVEALGYEGLSLDDAGRVELFGQGTSVVFQCESRQERRPYQGATEYLRYLMGLP